MTDIRIETLSTQSGWDTYPASNAVINAWRKVQSVAPERTVVQVFAGGDDRGNRTVDVPNAGLSEFVRILLDDPTVTVVKVIR